jgi:hypothetical protein
VTAAPELLAAIDERADAAAAAMASATDGASLCSVSRSGERIPGVKYPEGRWAAMRALRRALRRADAEAGAAIAALRAEWADDLAARRSTGQDNWIAYRLGGVDALDEVAALAHP